MRWILALAIAVLMAAPLRAQTPSYIQWYSSATEDETGENLLQFQLADAVRIFQFDKLPLELRYMVEAWWEYQEESAPIRRLNFSPVAALKYDVDLGPLAAVAGGFSHTSTGGESLASG